MGAPRQHQIVSWDSLTLTDVLGSGVQGVVHKGYLRLENDTRIEVVVKKALENDHNIIEEATALHHVGGAGGTPHLYGVTEDPVAMVMSLCPGTPLHIFLTVESQEHCLQAFVKICQALRDFHEAGYAHRDLHCANVLVEKDIRDKLQVHIIDVGMAQPLTGNERSDRNIVSKDHASLVRIAKNLLRVLSETSDTAVFRDTVRKMKPNEMNARLAEELATGLLNHTSWV
ncbi:uncharacterized protein [Panulirus ornatus]|uniref:uncharacterized protein n=1 Tax=Panulirus ornatus TaxID=150431 RepID=UPI003A84149A